MEEGKEENIPSAERKEVFGPLPDARLIKKKLTQKFPLPRSPLIRIDFRREGRTHPSITPEAVFPHALNNYEIASRHLREAGRGKESSLDVLEVGCGTGWGARYLVDNLESLQITATNRVIGKKDERVMEYAKNVFTTPRLNFAEADATRLAEQYGKDKFDAIIMLEVIEHIPREQHEEVIQQILQVLKPDGIFLMSTPSREGYGKAESGPEGGDHVWVYGNRRDLINLISPHFKDVGVNRMVNKIHTSTWGQSKTRDLLLAYGLPAPKEMFTNYQYKKGDESTDQRHVEDRDTCGWFVVTKKPG